MNKLATKEKFNKLILDHRDMAKKITYVLRSSFNIPSILIEDCISQGYLGLIEAARKYSTKKNFAFSTYASIIIKGRIIDYIRKYFKIKFGSKYNSSKNVYHDPTEISVTTSEDDTEDNQIISHRDFNNYLNKFIKPRRKYFSNEYLEQINGEEYFENRDILKHFWSKLTTTEKKIFYHHVCEGMTCQEIGKIMGASKSWVSKKQVDALAKYKEWSGIQTAIKESELKRNSSNLLSNNKKQGKNDE